MQPSPASQAEPGEPKNERLIGQPETPPPSGPLMAGVANAINPVRVEESYVAPVYPTEARELGIEARVILQALIQKDGTVATVEVLKCTHPDTGFEASAIEAVKQWRYQPARQNGKPVDVYFTVTIDFALPEDGEAGEEVGGTRSTESIRLARHYLDDRGSTDVSFKEAAGYWANTYVPGDPSVRLLRSRLAGWDRSVLRDWLPETPQLHEAARQAGQPFDAPGDSALAVYLNADRRGVTEPTRMLVQVGIEGTPRHGGRRPAMNISLVLDLRGSVTTETAQSVRALLDGFNRSQEPGDRFRVFVAGKPGGCVVPAESFRHGFIKVTLDRLLASGGDIEPVRGSDDLLETFAAAIEAAASTDDPTAPLGSSAVILITPGRLGAATSALADLAHQGAVSGIPTSIVGLGDGVEIGELDRVTLSGQGQRRLLGDATEATALVDRELASVSRAIARAVRLRVRLAPGVELIDVLGSERLDSKRADRVREAERSIDLRLSRNLGIQADRGEDEEGIQIVIPSFYAGDSHVILLDVVAPGPGAIADVTVRYKDLVHLRNGVARDSLHLGHDPRIAGPLERSVFKNLLSHELAQALAEAGRALRAGNAMHAAATLGQFRGLLTGLGDLVPGLDNDADLARDVTMLDEYRLLIAAGLPRIQLDYLADSLSYAARRMVLPRPMET